MIRVRFAPSPTGFLHVGSVRAALFSWLYAKRFGGQFLLRIEDTDLERSEQRYTDDIMASMKWLGLNWDEEPIFQSQRLDLYKAKALELVAKGHAYWCYSTEAEIEEMRKKAMAEGKKPMYDRTWRDRGAGAPKPGEPAVIRIKTPLEGTISWTDLICGKIEVSNTEIDDFVIIRSNGAPTYNLSVVIDDAESKMTHVIRGDDHINNTPKQLHLYKYLGYEIPHFAHAPMILGPDKQKLSKRHGAVSVNAYRADGFLPETMLNFLVRLGWSHGDQEVFTVEELKQFFDFDHVQRSPAVFNMEKLLWLNGEHLRKADPARLAAVITADYADYFKAPGHLGRVNTNIGEKLVGMLMQKVKLLKDVAEPLVSYTITGALEVDTKDLKWNKDPNLKASTQNAVRALQQALAQCVAKGRVKEREARDQAAWGQSPSLDECGLSHTDVEAIIKQVGETHGLKLGDFMQPIRLCLTGRSASPSIFELLTLLPWDVVEPRLFKVGTL